MKTVAQFVCEHSLFEGMDLDQVIFVAGCGVLERFDKGAYLTRENDPADYFYLILDGRVVIETHQINRPPIPLLTINSHEVVGWSWLIPPYRYNFDARALTPLRTVKLDGRCLRDKCESDNVLGYALLKRLSSVMVDRIHCARLQLLDVYSALPEEGLLR